MGRARARAAPSTLLSPSLPPTQLFLQAASNAALNCTQPGGTRSGSPADGGGAAASAHARYASLAPWHATRAALSTAGSSPGMRGRGRALCVSARAGSATASHSTEWLPSRPPAPRGRCPRCAAPARRRPLFARPSLRRARHAPSARPSSRPLPLLAARWRRRWPLVSEGVRGAAGGGRLGVEREPARAATPTAAPPPLAAAASGKRALVSVSDKTGLVDLAQARSREGRRQRADRARARLARHPPTTPPTLSPRASSRWATRFCPPAAPRPPSPPRACL